MDEKKIYSSTNVVPPTIIDAIKNNRLVIFVGAGISALYGFPLWDSLANDLVDYCYKVGCITNSEKDTILHCGYSSVQKISIATYRLGKKNNGRDIGLDYIVKVLSKKRNKKHLEIQNNKEQKQQDNDDKKKTIKTVITTIICTLLFIIILLLLIILGLKKCASDNNERYQIVVNQIPQLNMIMMLIR